jgi:hypothetical protein
VHQSRKSSFHAIRAASQKAHCDAACASNGIAGSSFKSIQMINNGKKPAFRAARILSEFLIQESLTAHG